VALPIQPREQLSAESGVFVRAYRIAGCTVFSQAELERTVAPLRPCEGHGVNPAEIRRFPLSQSM
jgi:hypothetical protein